MRPSPLRDPMVHGPCRSRQQRPEAPRCLLPPQRARLLRLVGWACARQTRGHLAHLALQQRHVRLQVGQQLHAHHLRPHCRQTDDRTCEDGRIAISAFFGGFGICRLSGFPNLASTSACSGYRRGSRYRGLFAARRIESCAGVAIRRVMKQRRFSHAARKV